MKNVRTLLFALSFCAVSQAAVAQSSLIDGQVTKVDQSRREDHHQARPDQEARNG